MGGECLCKTIRAPGILAQLLDGITISIYIQYLYVCICHSMTAGQRKTRELVLSFHPVSPEELNPGCQV